MKVAFLQGEQVVYVDRTGSTLRQAVAALLAGPTAAERGREIASEVPAGTPLRAVSVANGVATVDLGERFATGTKAASLSARVTQLVLTATSVPGVKSVRLLVKGGTPLGLFPGYVTSGPISASGRNARRTCRRPARPRRARRPIRRRPCARSSSGSPTSRSSHLRRWTARPASRRGSP